MTPLLPLGLAIALNIALLTGGMVCLRRQMKRVEVERANEYRGLFRLEPPPATGDKVQILIEDDDGRMAEIKGTHWLAIGWMDAVTMLRVERNAGLAAAAASTRAAARRNGIA